MRERARIMSRALRFQPARQGRMALCCVLVGVAFASLIGCGGDSSPAESSTADSDALAQDRRVQVIPLVEGAVPPGKSDLAPIHWRLASPPKGRQVQVFSAEGYCIGESPPQYEAVRVSERDRKVLITTYVRTGRPTERELCRGVGGFQRGIVVLPHGVSGAQLYDASTTPPSRRWPS